MMLRASVVVSAVLGAVAIIAAPIPESSGPVPVLIARIQPVEKLFADAKFLAAKFGKADAGAKFEATVLHNLGASSIADIGIDPTKPSGAYIFLKPELKQSIVVVMLPVASEKAILDFVGKFQVKSEKLEDGLYSLNMPQQPLPVFVRFANGYAYVTAMHKAAVAAGAVLPPARIFPANETAMLAVTIRPDQVPEPLRKTAMAQFNDYMKLVGADVEQLPTAMMKTTSRWADAIVEGGRDITLNMTFERASCELHFDLGMNAKTGSKLAEQIATVRPSKSLFGKMVGDSGAFNLHLNTGIALEPMGEIVKMFRDPGDGMFGMAFWTLQEPKLREEYHNVLKSMVPTIESGEFDAAASLHGPVNSAYTVLFATKLREGKKVDDAFRKFVGALPKDKKARMKLDAETVNGVPFHRYTPPAEDVNEYEKKVFGNPDLCVGIREDAMIMGYGAAAMKEVPAAMLNAKNSPSTNFQMDLSLQKLKTLLNVFGGGASDFLQQYFGKDADRVRIYAANVEGGQTMKGRFTIGLQTIAGSLMGVGITEDNIILPGVPPVPPPPVPPGKPVIPPKP